MTRKAVLKRETSEVSASVELDLDGTGKFDISTGVPFFDHMLSQLAKHGYFDLTVKAEGDIDVDFHHTVEDVGIALGEAFSEALGDKRGITRYGHALIPFDDALVVVAVDLSDRPCFVFKGEIPAGKVGDFDSELAEEFFKSLTNSLRCNLHIEFRHGTNLHHIIEAMFKALGRSMDTASALDGRRDDIPSTKGTL
ncbi:MAG: imidazoleglycerol-phosphate dehydratase HisB [Candidatus Dadabacteria bacterium]|nr:imidazoleglycerol-phosphate dehydratase HisB [Candidatus Dadabacteria bacterium]MYB26710.1 imidazoleglycerol-phosphate dehydratase HisB [Candidatus Dadabacteria bacterium]